VQERESPEPSVAQAGASPEAGTAFSLAYSCVCVDITRLAPGPEYWASERTAITFWALDPDLAVPAIKKNAQTVEKGVTTQELGRDSREHKGQHF
jgi:hypothetical protein